MIAVLDLDGLGAAALRQAFSRAGLAAGLAASQVDLERAERIVIPDVPDFAAALLRIRERGWVGPLLRAAGDRPLLAVGQGLALLCDAIHGHGLHTGLGLLHGKALPLDPGRHPAARHFSLPHRGWNQVFWDTGVSPLLSGLSSGEYFYFDHFIHAEPLDAAAIQARANHGVFFAAVVQAGKVHGVQFLPEKSEEAGLRVLKNFAVI